MNSDFQEKRIVIYARVSTEHEAQLSALENQVDWYRPILAARPNWELVGQYVDEGITGTSAQKRPQFMRMINDAKQHKFDMIITREVSRFARNTVDTLQYTRLLKDEGVEVFFINDNIKTFDGDGELRLTIMATLAQDESRKTSIRVKAGQQTSMNNGVYYGNGNILGYDRVDKNTFVINPEQAKTVRMIFDMYLSGFGITKIQYELEKQGRKTAMGKTKWYASVILKMLHNSFYCGVVTYHKEYVPDYLKQKRIINHGEIELFTRQGTHEPIVTVEEFEQVQKLLAQRRTTTSTNSMKGRKPQSTIWGRLMVCQCGNKFNLHFHQRQFRSPGIDYQCYTSANLGSKTERQRRGLNTAGSCDTPFIPGWKMEMMTGHVFKNYVENGQETLDLALKILEKHLADKEDDDYDELIRQKKDEIMKLQKRLFNLIEMRQDGDIERDFFVERKQLINEQIAVLDDEIAELSKPKKSDIKRDFVLRIEDLKEKLDSYIDFDTSPIPENVIEAFVEKIWVSKDEFRWYLRTSINIIRISPFPTCSFVYTTSITTPFDWCRKTVAVYTCAVFPH